MKTKKLARLRIRLLVFGIILTTVMFNAGSFISLMVEQEGILKGGYRIAAGILLLISAFGGLMIVASDILLKKLKKSTVPPILFGCLTPAHLSIILSLHLTIIYISLYWFFSVSNDQISFLLFFAGCGVPVSICFALIRKSVVIRERRMGMMAQRDSSAVKDVNIPARLTASGLRLRIEKFGLNEDVLSHLVIRDSEISADLLMSGGSPFMRCDGADTWSGATSIDSMRGPASFSGLSFEEALKKVTDAVEYMLKHPESDVCYGESGADKKMEIQSENSSESLAPKRTFVCPQCKKELPIKYLYKNGMCTYCCEHPAPKPKEKPKLRNIGGVRPQPSESTIRDPYAYERKHVWAKQIELIHIPDMSVPCEPVDGASQEEVRRYYTVSNETIYIDSRDGHLIRASIAVPAFNACGASRSDMPCEYEYMHDKVKKYINESRVKFSVKDPAVLLELNEYNWEDWLLEYKYDCIGTKKDQLGTKGSYATSAPKRSESRQPETNTRISSTDDRKLEMLFEWEDRSKDIYEATGICFSYDLVSRELYSHSFHYVDAGCGSIGGNSYSTDTRTSWDSLLKNVKYAQYNGKIFCRWETETWEQLCRDYAEHPEMKCEPLDELTKLLKDRRSRD